MKSQEQQPNIFNLESDKSADLFMQEIINEFRKLPKLKRSSICAEKMDELEEINNSIRLAVEEATKTGSTEKIEEAKKLQADFNEKAEVLKQLIWAPKISAEYIYKDEKGKETKETITLDIEKNLNNQNFFMENTK